ncbi:hypothetical protein [Burkholderia sp. Z1]|uniref:hypothetical protein n=1 Tax=Burkholderia sp. Z1 TaxID=2759039 RepID=UPI0018681C05|nr:hypothetical protein [Burkholderia sp. Z1]
MLGLQMINVADRVKSLILGCVFVVVSASGCASPMDSFVGEWGWSNSSGTMTFSIDLKKQGDRLYGQYCAIAQNGNKIDCDDEENKNIDGIIGGDGKSAFVNFYSFFGAKNGNAFLRMVNGRLIWHVVRNPIEGEFYAPKNAILVPHQLMMERMK